jgi:hypothetical protein
MASTTRWIIDTAWTAVTFTASNLNSLPSGGGALSTGVIANGTNLDQFADFSFAVTVGTGGSGAGGFVTLYLLPLNQDGTTYGDGYVTNNSAQPSAGYAIGSIGVSTGTAATGMIQFVNLPPGSFKLVFGNNVQNTLSATASLTLSYRSYNVNLNV